MTQPNWTLTLDESGNFESEDHKETLIIGGALAPDEKNSITTSWTGHLKKLCQDMNIANWPPHATTLPWNAREHILKSLSQKITSHGGHWLFVVKHTQSSNKNKLSIYAHMLSETVDIAARISALHGARTLSIYAASRTIPVSMVDAEIARDRGLALQVNRTKDTASDHSIWIKSHSEAEIRQSLDALSRERQGLLMAYPRPSTIRAETAHYGGAHPGIFYADFACNFLRRTLTQTSLPIPHEREAVLSQANMTIIDHDSLEGLRELDRALREDPPDLLRAARFVEEPNNNLSTRKSTTPTPAHVATHKGSLLAAKLIWDRSLSHLGNSLLRRNAASTGITLSDRVQSALSTKSGNYNSTWTALDAGWAGGGTVARSVRRHLATNREASARLWRQALECANHRGDISSAQTAQTEFTGILRHGISISLLAEAHQLDVLSHVYLQNHLPCSEDAIDDIVARLKQAANTLIARADEAGVLLGLASHKYPDLSSMESSPDALEAAIPHSPLQIREWHGPDRERGQMYGTASRTLAFCGEHEKAIHLALLARRHFAGSPEDLRINAAILARILIDRCRITPGAGNAGLSEVLASAGIRDFMSPAEASRTIKSDMSARFTLDLILRTLLWAPGVIPESQWIDALCSRERKAILSTLSAGHLGSHPTEMIARHAGEFLLQHNKREMSDLWFTLSRRLGETAPPESTLYRISVFTNKLATEPEAVPAGRSGSVLNPNFEYR
ncbi:hypothetical protein [Myxococcus xanthus]|uniref:DUF3800 domain-containing protein n=1 Tax=Myxococcus xanthus TaxID=34 RepID=A0A7Y4MV76_MYXXA|nr:hypothetical protein [Myxococcus xanthus]NOJ83397.1 hypothetical protein [Myxococcus xanthus]NOJ90721.1 hypothetical protein [Myxococcus xanthus]